MVRETTALLESTVGQQLPELAFSNKGALVLADVLAHQSGLAAGFLITSEPLRLTLQKHFGIRLQTHKLLLSQGFAPARFGEGYHVCHA